MSTWVQCVKWSCFWAHQNPEGAFLRFVLLTRRSLKPLFGSHMVNPPQWSHDPSFFFFFYRFLHVSAEKMDCNTFFYFLMSLLVSYSNLKQLNPAGTISARFFSLHVIPNFDQCRLPNPFFSSGTMIRFGWDECGVQSSWTGISTSPILLLSRNKIK